MKIVAAALVALALSSAAQAAELIFVQADGCIHCIRFNRQMAAPYRASESGRKVPLRDVDLAKRWPADLGQVDRPPYTPVFILVEDGRELGRFNGYLGPKQFNREVKRLLRRLPG